MRFLAFLIFVAALFASPGNAVVAISEFLAENDGGLADEDGTTADWIELHNDSGAAVNLAGWHLTDSTNAPAKWTFPSTNIAAGAYMVVFASGKNRTNAGGTLHTNFQLDKAGEYLALVDLQGVAVSEFSPEYPRQRSNRSFAVESRVVNTTFVAAGTMAPIFVPMDDSLGSAWTLPNFDASGWTQKPIGLGFDRGANAGGVESEILKIDFNDDDSGETGAANTETGFATMTLSQNPSVINGVTITLSALGGATLDDRDRATPTQSAALTQDQIYDDFIFANGTFDGAGLRILMTGLQPNQDYNLKIWSFDSGSAGARVSDWVETASGVSKPVITGYTFDGSVLPTVDGQSTFTASVHSSSEGALQIEGRRNGGTSHGVFLNGLQLTQPGYGSAIRGDVGDLMLDKNASLYLRIPFSLGAAPVLDRLKLTVRYDDGFVAYLNGQEIARRNAPDATQWNSAATVNRSKSDALTIEEIDVSNFISSLTPGLNVLAIQAMNASADDEDFLIAPELFGEKFEEQAAVYFAAPTPGVPNGVGYPGFVDDTKFSVDRGFYDAPFQVEITTVTPGAQIRYTTNGAAPTETTGFVYEGPISVTNTTTLRAAAFKSGLIPSDVDTQSYIFLDQILHQPAMLPDYPTIWQASYPADYEMDPNVVNSPTYGPEIKDDLRAIPTLSIVTDFDGLWNPSTGIYPNATSSGAAWERAGSVELINADGTTGFAVRCGLRMQGNASRDNVRTPKHSIRLLFKGEYGPTKLSYLWFPDTKIDRFDNIVLRACFTDSWSTRNGGDRYHPDVALYLRDVWVKDSLHDMDRLSGRGNFVHLYLNGLYWGVYNPTERLDASYFATHLGGADEDWDVIRDFSEALAGSKTEWSRMIAIVNAGITDEMSFQQVAQLVDVENLIDYILLHIYAEAEDWPQHNWYAARRRASATLPATKWIFLSWDQEIVLDQLVRRNRIDVTDDDTPARIYSQLRGYPEFRRMFGDRIQKHLFNGGALTPTRNVERMQGLAAKIEKALVGESARWGDAREFTIGPNPGTGKTFAVNENWKPELDKLCTNFFPHLHGDNVARFRAGNLYPVDEAPIFSQFGGNVPSGFALTITNPNLAGSIYYTVDGSDPRVYGTGAIAPTANAYGGAIPIAKRTLVRSRTYRAGAWSALVEAEFFPPQDFSKLLLTEVMYHPKAAGEIDGDEFEFVELQNSGTETLTLTGLRFAAGIGFAFTNDTMLAPGAFLVLAANGEQFSNRYPSVKVEGVYSGKLDNGGEQIALTTATGETIFSIAYSDHAPWPGADGDGDSLQYVQGPQANGTSWVAATPTPGEPALAFSIVQVTDGFIEFRFYAAGQRTYSIYRADSLDGNWVKLSDVPALANGRAVSISDTTPGVSTRFYRLASP